MRERGLARSIVTLEPGYVPGYRVSKGCCQGLGREVHDSIDREVCVGRVLKSTCYQIASTPKSEKPHAGVKTCFVKAVSWDELKTGLQVAISTILRYISISRKHRCKCCCVNAV